MEDKKTAVFGIYPTVEQAEEGVDALVQAAFSNTDISVLVPERPDGSGQLGTRDFAHEKNTKAPEGTTTGAATGGAIGGTMGLLAGIGALVGALVGMGIPEYEAKRYEGRVKDGGILLSVHCDTSDEITQAKAILEQTGAEDISSSGEATGTGVGSKVSDRTRM